MVSRGMPYANSRGRGSSSRGRGRGGFRGRGGARQHQRAQQEQVMAAHEAMSEETTSFFHDLAAGQLSLLRSGETRAAPRQDHAEQPQHQALATLPGEAIRIAPGQVGSQQTQEAVLWLDLGLCKALVRATSHLGFISPTPVQAEAIPAIISGADVCARAVTGSGKTAAFLLPLAHLLLTRPPQRAAMLSSKRRYIRAVVLLPTRELGVQCEDMLRKLLQFTTGLTIALAIGGVAPAAQEAALDAAPDILIATPGRLVDFVHNFRGGAGLDLSGVELLVLDECDRMLTLNLCDQVADVMEHVPAETRQVAMFSATMTEEVDQFAREHLYKPRNVDIGHVALQSQLRQQFVRIRTVPAADAEATDAEEAPKEKRVRSKRLREEARSAQQQAGEALTPAEAEREHISKTKSQYLVALCRNYFTSKTIIFCRYRTTVHRLALLFTALGLSAAEVQGHQAQSERLSALQRFAADEVRYLITTDVASRGIDIKGVATVINFDLPSTLTAYIHRVGRTARIGEVGTAVSLVQEVEDADIMRKILAISGAINEHQVASVKRRDVPVELLRSAAAAIDAKFPLVRSQLAAEQLEERIATAEKRYGRSESFAERLTTKPKREWCLSKEEQRRRDAEARQQYERDAEVTINHFQNELSNLEREESGILRRQRTARRVARERKERDQSKVKERARELRKKEEKKIQAGLVKKLKKRQIRKSIREQRAEKRASSGRTGTRPTKSSKRHSASRHKKRVKKH